jgi:hypothetical protein
MSNTFELNTRRPYLDFDFSGFAGLVTYFAVSPALHEVPRPSSTSKFEVGGKRRFLRHSEIHTWLGCRRSSTEGVRLPLDFASLDLVALRDRLTLTSGSSVGS